MKFLDNLVHILMWGLLSIVAVIVLGLSVIISSLFMFTITSVFLINLFILLFVKFNLLSVILVILTGAVIFLFDKERW